VSRQHSIRVAGRVRLALLGTSAALAAAALGTASLGATVGSAQAASLPSVGTGGATQVSFSSAVVHGTVDPKGSETLYYFQYGLTSAYTAQTGIVSAGAGTKPLHVSVALSGLSPLSRYHYRLVAVNGLGRAVGGDKAFMTLRIPLSLQILVSSNPVPFGGTVTVQGTLAGTGNANREVVLQANPFPFAGFVNVENPQLTSTEGGFAFHVLGLKQATQYRVVSITHPVVVSPVASETVTVRISARSHRLRGARGHRKRLVRFFGSVTPALDGTHIAIMHEIHGRELFVAGGALRHLSASSSRFDRRVRVRPGIYRILVPGNGGGLSSAYSAPLLVR
jgi:hypothetical protein